MQLHVHHRERWTHVDDHKPTRLEKNFCASSASGYWNNSSGVSGAAAARVIIVNRRGPTVIHRIDFTTPMALVRSASDWRSALPNSGSPSGIEPPIHLASNSFT